MNEPAKQVQVAQETVEDLNLSATKIFHQLLEVDTTLVPAWKEAALKLSEKEVPQDIGTLKALLEGGKDAILKTTQS